MEVGRYIIVFFSLSVVTFVHLVANSFRSNQGAIVRHSTLPADPLGSESPLLLEIGLLGQDTPMIKPLSPHAFSNFLPFLSTHQIQPFRMPFRMKGDLF